ncbi:MAG: phosphopantothenoylcysteine decarboxylase [Bacteroidota bacterium]|nr:phosphopantothenoylcysteine decarboxylase [Bacteroidota bacterium]
MLYIKLVKNRDIAFEVGDVKRINQLSIGFAMETNDEMKHAIEKLQHKNFDMVVLNSKKMPELHLSMIPIK